MWGVLLNAPHTFHVTSRWGVWVKLPTLQKERYEMKIKEQVHHDTKNEKIIYSLQGSIVEANKYLTQESCKEYIMNHIIIIQPKLKKGFLIQIQQ